jgi:cbb3-type cytochrome oxidase maturation protein
MNSLFLLVPLGILFVATAGLLLMWAFRSGQFEDLDEIGRSVLDEEPLAPPSAVAARPARSAAVHGVRPDDSRSR